MHCRVKHDRLPSYSITSSAVASGDCGTVTLISVLAVLLAVLRLREETMLRLGRGYLIRWLVAILCIVGISWLALEYFVPSPPSKITIATALRGTTYDYFGQRYRGEICDVPASR